MFNANNKQGTRHFYLYTKYRWAGIKPRIFFPCLNGDIFCVVAHVSLTPVSVWEGRTKDEYRPTKRQEVEFFWAYV